MFLNREDLLTPEKYDLLISYLFRVESLNEVHGLPKELKPLLTNFMFRCMRIKFFTEKEVHRHLFHVAQSLKEIIVFLESLYSEYTKTVNLGSNFN